MYGYNELGEARNLLALIEFCQCLKADFTAKRESIQKTREGRKDIEGQPQEAVDVWYLLATLSHFNTLKRQSSYSGTTWKGRPYELLTKLSRHEAGKAKPEGSDIASASSDADEDEFLREESIFHTSGFPEERQIVNNAYRWTTWLDTLRATDAFFSKIKEILCLGKDADGKTFKAVVESYKGWVKGAKKDNAVDPLDALFSETFKSAATSAYDRQTMDLFDKGISNLERVARYWLSNPDCQTGVAIPHQVLEMDGKAELALCMALIYVSLKKQNVTADDLKPVSSRAGHNWWPLPGGRVGFSIYTGFVADTYKYRVSSALAKFDSNPPICMTTFHQQVMCWMRDDVFTFFAKAEQNIMAKERQSLDNYAGDNVDNNDACNSDLIENTDNSGACDNIMSVLRAFPFGEASLEAYRASLNAAEHTPARSVASSSRSNPDKNDVLLLDDGGKMSYLQICDLISTQKDKSESREEEDLGKQVFMFLLKVKKPMGTKQQWVNSLEAMNSIMKNTLFSLSKKGTEPFQLSLGANYSKRFKENDGVGTLLMMFLYFRNHVIQLPSDHIITDADYDVFDHYRRWIGSVGNTFFTASVKKDDVDAFTLMVESSSFYDFITAVQGNAASDETLSRILADFRNAWIYESAIAINTLKKGEYSVAVKENKSASTQDKIEFSRRYLLAYLCFTNAQAGYDRISWSESQNIEDSWSFETDLTRIREFVAFLMHRERRLLVKKRKDGTTRLSLEGKAIHAEMQLI